MLEGVQQDRSFVTDLVYGTIRQHRALRWFQQELVRKPPRREVMSFLDIGLYQLFYMGEVEVFAAVHETVEAAKETVTPDEVRLVNAVLREADRERRDLRRRLGRQSLGVSLSHPEILVRRWKHEFGERNARLLCEWNNRPAEVVIRLNLQRMAMDTFHGRLAAAGVAGEPHPFAPRECRVLPHGVRVRDVPGFEEGLFYVQDPSTLVAVRLLDPQPGERILDACAAPGGKTALIAERLQGSGSVQALDLYEDRLERLRTNLARLGCQGIEIAQGDAGTWTPDPAGRPLFDRILLDVPCTNTGVIRRRPDARWRFSPDRLRNMTQHQGRILDHMAGLVRPGGCLVYSTCSLENEENDDLVRAWVRRHPEFRLVKSERLFPPKTQTDGAYAARLERAEGA
jgi:16S rRNA (cytosine967-C5)-methyltransferase